MNEDKKLMFESGHERDGGYRAMLSPGYRLETEAIVTCTLA